jgi:hypothetical protein
MGEGETAVLFVASYGCETCSFIPNGGEIWRPRSLDYVHSCSMGCDTVWPGNVYRWFRRTYVATSIPGRRVRWRWSYDWGSMFLRNACNHQITLCHIPENDVCVFRVFEKNVVRTIFRPKRMEEIGDPIKFCNMGPLCLSPKIIMDIKSGKIR